MFFLNTNIGSRFRPKTSLITTATINDAIKVLLLALNVFSQKEFAEYFNFLVTTYQRDYVEFPRVLYNVLTVITMKRIIH
jgi:hypothetical protein